MKTLFVATLLLLLAATCYASQEAITDTGEKVILNSDGTWVYSNNAPKPATRIGTNKKKFEKPNDSNFLLKSTKNNSAFWINTVKWSFMKKQDDAEAEYQFQLKGKDLYGLAITEGIEISPKSLVDLALGNFQSAAPGAKMVMQEYRVVNGKKVIYMETNVTLKDVDFTYCGYYYSNSSGTTQLVAYTATKVVAKYRSEINDFLNGLVTQQISTSQ